MAFSRTRRRLLIRLGTAASVMILVTWVVSVWWIIGYGNTTRWCSVGCGCFTACLSDDIATGSTGWYVYKADGGFGFWWPYFGLLWPGAFQSALELPFWFLLSCVALPTGYLWRHERRYIAPGHCQVCGYNLRGNVSGTCPECGSS